MFSSGEPGISPVQVSMASVLPKSTGPFPDIYYVNSLG